MINRKEIFEKYIEEVTSFSNIEGNKNTDLPDGRLKEDSIDYFVEDDNFQQFINFALGKKIEIEKLREPIKGLNYSRREILISLGILTQEEINGSRETLKKFWNIDSIYLKRNQGFAIFFITSPKKIFNPENDLSKNYDNYVSEDKSEVIYKFKMRGEGIDEINYEINNDSSISKRIKIFKEVGDSKSSKNHFEYLGEYSVVSFEEKDKQFKLRQNANFNEMIDSNDLDELYSKNHEKVDRSFDKIIHKMEISETEKIALVKLRTSQGKIRKESLEKYIKGEFVEVKNQSSLIASHIKPWRDSNNVERDDIDNILLLDTITDSLFDRGLITFDQNGNIIISNNLFNEMESNSDYELMAFLKRGKRIIMNNKRREYMSYHENNIFIDNKK